MHAPIYTVRICGSHKCFQLCWSGFAGTGVPRFAGTGVPGFAGTEVRYRSIRVCWYWYQYDDLFFNKDSIIIICSGRPSQVETVCMYACMYVPWRSEWKHENMSQLGIFVSVDLEPLCVYSYNTVRTHEHFKCVLYICEYVRIRVWTHTSKSRLRANKPTIFPWFFSCFSHSFVYVKTNYQYKRMCQDTFARTRMYLPTFVHVKTNTSCLDVHVWPIKRLK
jgi:hypothetical protein